MHLVLWVAPYASVAACILVAMVWLFGLPARLSTWGQQGRPCGAGRRHDAADRRPRAAVYIPWADTDASSTLVVDCTHGSARTVTHHKGSRNPPGGHSDTSTGLLLDALARASAGGPAAAELAPWLDLPTVSVNHFDADAVLSVYGYCNQGTALQHSALLRHAARIGDLREAGLGDDPEAAAARRWDGVTTAAQVHHALQLNCWINTVERTRFSPPYVDKDADAKFAYVLQRLGAALTPEGIEALRPVGVGAGWLGAVGAARAHASASLGRRARWAAS